MTNKYFMIAIIFIIVLGSAAFGFKKFVDQKAGQEIEQKLSLATGLNTTCTKANVNLFQNNIQFMDIKVNNIPGFNSSYIFSIKNINIQAKSLLKKPLEIENIVIEDVNINVDAQFNINASTPDNIIAINLKQLSEKANKPSNQDLNKPNELLINQMQFKNIKVATNVQIPGKNTSLNKEFTIDQITLNQVTDKNLPDKLAEALQAKILTQVTAILNNEKSLPKSNLIVDQLNKIKLPLSPSLPQKPSLPSLPSPSFQPEKPPLPFPPGLPSPEQKPSPPFPPN